MQNEKHVICYAISRANDWPVSDRTVFADRFK